MRKAYKSSWIDTPLGPLFAVADGEALCHLEFDSQLEQFLEITPGICAPLQSIETELKAYFAGKLKEFKTPLKPEGTPFQWSVWQALQTIPYGETRSYSAIAEQLGKPTAYRAAANANGKNPIVIVIPCHRVISSNGTLGGYNCGLPRKEWLLQHEGLKPLQRS